MHWTHIPSTAGMSAPVSKHKILFLLSQKMLNLLWMFECMGTFTRKAKLAFNHKWCSYNYISYFGIYGDIWYVLSNPCLCSYVHVFWHICMYQGVGELYRFFFLNKVFLTYLYCHHNGASTSYVIELLGLYMLFMKISEVTPLSSASGLASKDTTNHHDLSFCVLGLQGGAQEHRNSRKGGGTSRACRSYGVILKLFMITSTMKQGVGLF